MQSNFFFYLILICFCTACGSKNPGMSKEEVTGELTEQTTDAGAVPQMVSASGSEFIDGYVPPAGIKFQSKIQKDGAVSLNVSSALKNVHAMKVNELGKMRLHFTGVDAMLIEGIACDITPIQNTYLLTTVQGLFLLDNDFKIVKQLFKNDVDCSLKDGYIHLDTREMVIQPYYDASFNQLRCSYLSKKHKNGNYIITLPLNEIVAATEPWTPNKITSKLPIGRVFMNASFYNGIEGGFIKSVPFSRHFYTHGVEGDTLCSFVPEEEDYTPTGTYRTGETNHTYVYRNKTYVRMAYDNTVYFLENAYTLKAAYHLDFGVLRRPQGKKVIGSSNLDNDFFIVSWLETDHYLLIRMSKGYDSPNARKAGSVSLYSLIYDKKTKEFFSLPSVGANKEPDFPVIDAGNGQEISCFPKLVAGNTLISYVNGKWIKENKPELLESKEVSDNELVLISIE